jgi:glycosyltransferase involved in cell wall biosynthesis
LRVALILPAFFPNDVDFMGGGDRYVHKLSQALTPYCDVTFFTFGPSYREELLAGVRHVVLPGRPGANPDNPVPSSLAFASSRFDVVHAFHLRTVVTNLATIVRRATRRPLVVTDLGGGGRSATFKLQLYRLIPAFICISDFSRSLLPSRAQARAVVIKGGIDPNRFAYDDRPRQRQVLQVSRLMPHKGQNDLIEAAGQDLPVVIAGKVVNRAYYEDLRKMASGKPVRFLIDVDDEAILDAYRHSAVTVQASVYRDLYGGSWPTSELLGLPLLESMSVGTPVVCTRVGGMPEFVRDGVTGFIVPPNDPAALRRRLDDVLGDPQLASAMGRAGHEDMAQYSWDSVARRVSAEYARLGAGA